MNVSNKQFVLSSKKKDICDMEEIPLSHSFLYAGKNLKVEKVRTQDGIDVILLGYAFCMDEIGITPTKVLSKSNSNDIADISRWWTGRWALLYNNQFFTDATGLMNAFYFKSNEGWIISSSLALMSKIIEVPITKAVNTTGLSWQILPSSLIDNVNTLFCTQKCVWGDDGLDVVFQNRIYDYTDLPLSEKVERLSTMLKNALCNIQKFSGKNITLALTAGKDSRLVLSAALSAGIHFDSYTALHPNISSSDRKLPPEMAKRIGFRHNLIKPHNRDNNKYNEYLEFCGNNSKGADIIFYSNGQFEDFNESHIIIRSGIFEAAQQYGRLIIKGNTIEQLEDGIRNYYSSDMNEKQARALSDWVEYAKNNPIDYIDIRDRFYIEQRVNGWVAAIEQSLDINDFTSIQIANCSELISILLSATKEERERLALSFDSIKLMTPELMKYPVNQRYLSDTLRIYVNGIKKRIKRLIRCN